MGKISIKNIKQYVEGNLNMLKEEVLGKSSIHFKEQILYRASKCQDCYRLEKCLVCGCSLPGKHYVKESCNDGVRFPDLMEEKEWNEYKQEEGIQIDLKDE